MSLSSLNISLPAQLKSFVEQQVREGGYSTPSEYVRELLRQDQRRRAEEELERQLLEGLRSGTPLAGGAEYWERKRARLMNRKLERSGRG